MLVCSVAVMSAGCEHPDTDEVLPYYFTERMVYLGRADRTFEIKHSSAGVVNDNVKMSFPVGVSKAYTEELTVKLELEVTGEGLTKENVVFTDGDVVKIPAGELSVNKELRISDWAFANDNKAAATYEINVRILEVAPSAVLVAPEMQHVTYRINKSAYTAVETGNMPSGDFYPDSERAKWHVQISEAASDSQWTDTSALTEDAIFTEEDVKTEGNYLGVSIDMQKTLTLTGVSANFLYGASYCPTMSQLEVSTDGVTWLELMPKAPVTMSRYTLYVSFFDQVDARFIRWRFYNENVLWLDEVYVHVPNEVE